MLTGQVFHLDDAGPSWTGKENIFKTLNLILEKSPHCIRHFPANQERLPAGESVDSDDEGLFYIQMPSMNNSEINSSSKESKKKLHLILTSQDILLRSRQASLKSSTERLKRVHEDQQQWLLCTSNAVTCGKVSGDCSGAEVEFIYVPSECCGWRISWRGLLHLIQQELTMLGRDREYRVHMAAALSGLPWTSFYADNDNDGTLEIEQIHCWLQTCAPFMSLTGMAPAMVLEVVDSWLSVFISDGNDSPKFYSDICSILQNQKHSLVADINKLSEIDAKEQVELSKKETEKHKVHHLKAAHRSKFNMFGGRYGEGSTDSKSIVDKPDLKNGNDSVGQESEELNERTFKSSLDPAFRQHVILAVAQSWPPADVLKKFYENTLSGRDYLWRILGIRVLPLFSAWILGQMRGEVWSVRRAALTFQSALFNWLRVVLVYFPISDDTAKFDEIALCDVVEECLECLMIGAAEVKYSQIRMATADGLVKFLESLCNAVVVSDESHIPLESPLLQKIRIAADKMISKILNMLSSDSVPAVLSSSSNAKMIWEVYKKSTVKKVGAVTSSCGDM